MRKLSRILTAGVALSLGAGYTFADWDVAPPDQFSWQENVGWMNWGDSPAGSEPTIHASYMSGYVWLENAGWMFLGDGSPVDGVNYANLDGTDYGVNYDPGTGNLFGFAWAENLGHVNFDTLAALGADRARFDLGAARLRGYVWFENAGWGNLDDATHFVAFTCTGDLTGDGAVDGADLAQLLADWGPGPGCASDLDGSGTVDGADLAALLAFWGPC